MSFINRLVISIDKFIGALLTRIQSSTFMPTWHSSIFRIFFGLYFLVFGLASFGWISEAPGSFFDPPLFSFSRLASGFPPPALFFTLDILIVLLMVFVTVGIRSRISGLALVLVYWIGRSFQYSFGKIDHDVMIWATLLCMSFSNWGTDNALLPEKTVRSHKTALAMLGIILSFGMFTAGYEKYQNWLDFDLSTNGFLSWFYPGYFNIGRQFLLSDFVFYIPSWLLELMDYSAVFLELTPFLCLLAGARFWKAWLLMACIFHLANLLILNIPFSHHIPVYSCFFLYPLLREGRLRYGSLFSNLIKGALVFAMAVGAIHLALRLNGSGTASFIKPSVKGTTSLLIDGCMWAAAVVLGGFSLLSTLNQETGKSLNQNIFQREQ
ncbi:MAG: hypothetical protein ACFBSG_11230 [Leptolyngbyaceae cyanobacterium]